MAYWVRGPVTQCHRLCHPANSHVATHSQVRTASSSLRAGGLKGSPSLHTPVHGSWLLTQRCHPTHHAFCTSIYTQGRGRRTTSHHQLVLVACGWFATPLRALLASLHQTSHPVVAFARPCSPQLGAVVDCCVCGAGEMDVHQAIQGLRASPCLTARGSPKPHEGGSSSSQKTTQH